MWSPFLDSWPYMEDSVSGPSECQVLDSSVADRCDLKATLGSGPLSIRRARKGWNIVVGHS